MGPKRRSRDLLGLVRRRHPFNPRRALGDTPARAFAQVTREVVGWGLSAATIEVAKNDRRSGDVLGCMPRRLEHRDFLV